MNFITIPNNLCRQEYIHLCSIQTYHIFTFVKNIYIFNLILLLYILYRYFFPVTLLLTCQLIFALSVSKLNSDVANPSMQVVGPDTHIQGQSCTGDGPRGFSRHAQHVYMHACSGPNELYGPAIAKCYRETPTFWVYASLTKQIHTYV